MCKGFVLKGLSILLLFMSCMTPPSIDSMMDQQMEMAKKMEKKVYGEVNEKDLALDIVDDTTLRKVVEVNSSVENTYSKLEKWIDNNFIDNADEILEKNDQDYQIKGKGSIVLTFQLNFGERTDRVYFEYSFEVKENRFRITIKNPYSFMPQTGVDGDSTITQKTYYGGATKLGLVSKAIKDKGLIESLVEYIEGTSSTDEDW